MSGDEIFGVVESIRVYTEAMGPEGPEGAREGQRGPEVIEGARTCHRVPEKANFLYPVTEADRIHFIAGELILVIYCSNKYSNVLSYLILRTNYPTSRFPFNPLCPRATFRVRF